MENQFTGTQTHKEMISKGHRVVAVWDNGSQGDHLANLVEYDNPNGGYFLYDNGTSEYFESFPTFDGVEWEEATVTLSQMGTGTIYVNGSFLDFFTKEYGLEFDTAQKAVYDHYRNTEWTQQGHLDRPADLHDLSRSRTKDSRRVKISLLGGA